MSVAALSQKTDQSVEKMGRSLAVSRSVALAEITQNMLATSAECTPPELNSEQLLTVNNRAKHKGRPVQLGPGPCCQWDIPRVGQSGTEYMHPDETNHNEREILCLAQLEPTPGRGAKRVRGGRGTVNSWWVVNLLSRRVAAKLMYLTETGQSEQPNPDVAKAFKRALDKGWGVVRVKMPTKNMSGGGNGTIFDKKV